LLTIFTVSISDAVAVIPADTVLYDTVRDGSATDTAGIYYNFSSTTASDVQDLWTYKPIYQQTVCATQLFLQRPTVGTASYQLRLVNSQVAANSNTVTAFSVSSTAYATSTFIFDPCVVVSNSVTSTVKLLETVEPSGGYEQINGMINASSSGYFEKIIQQRFYHANEDGSGVTEIYGDNYRLAFRMLGSSSSSFFEQPSSDAYGFGTGGASGTDLGLFGSLMRDIFAFLFVPSNTAWLGFESARDQLSNKIPFGYWTQISDSFSSPTSTATTTVFTIPAMGDLDAITLYNEAEVLADPIVGIVIPWVHTILIVFLWLGFLTYLTYRIVYFEL